MRDKILQPRHRIPVSHFLKAFVKLVKLPSIVMENPSHNILLPLPASREDKSAGQQGAGEIHDWSTRTVTFGNDPL
jgi:hypothetical protein